MSHLKSVWFQEALSAHNEGIDVIHDYGIRFIREYYKSFRDAKMDKVPAYDHKYVPDPFRYQYDLTMFIWLNYYTILSNEIKILRREHIIHPNAGHGAIADELLTSKTLYGITRTDFMFAAGELRWPTTVLDDGSHHGLFIRDPWSEKRVSAISHEVYKNVFSFGGGGQGKTLVSLAVGLMLFDYFLFTQKGARCMLSTVNKDKLNSVGWAYLCNLNSSTSPGISLTAGRSKISGDHTLSRPKNKDKGGVFKGILIGNQMNPQTIIDKLTGSHGHPFIAYIMDEVQSTPDPPITAAPNYTMHARDYRILASGNYGENNDTLANNIRPDNGWESVNETTGTWLSTMQNGSKAIVLHFNNNLSPGMTEEGNRAFPHLPSKKQLDEKYPDPKSRNTKNIGYRRFWIGFRVEEDGKNTVISSRMVKENLAAEPLNLSKITHKFFAFDSAQAEIDRNPLGIFHEGLDSVTGERVFGPSTIYLLRKATESLKYYHESAAEILEKCKKHNIISGGGVLDWTGRPAQAEHLAKENFQVTKLVYNKAVPDGKRVDSLTKRVERAIRLNISLDFKDDVPADKVCAHHVAENQISLGAWALRQYILAGRVRGINESLIKDLDTNRSLEEELFYRKFRYKNSAIHGSRFHLEPKDDFKKEYGFSPDILDILIEAAFYMLVVRKLPLTPVGNDVILQSLDEDHKPDHEDFNELWSMDGLDEFESMTQ